MYRQSAFMLNRNMQLFTTWMAGTVHWDFSGAAVGATRRIATVGKCVNESNCAGVGVAPLQRYS
jgi:hypothetical protein